jgi:hypothetical protein
MATVKELRDRLIESQGMKSDKRIVVLEAIFGDARDIESRAVKDPFNFPLEEIRGLRALLPGLEAAISRAKAGVKRMKAA